MNSPSPGGSATSSRPSPFASPRTFSGRSAAVSALTTISPASDVASISTVRVAAGPADEQLAVLVADEEEVEAAAVHARMHAQLHGAGRRAGPPDLAEDAPHAEARPGGARRMLGPVVEQEQGVAAELQEPAALGVRDVEQRRERRVHDVVHFLRAGLAEVRQLLRHRREPGDVDERDRRVELVREPVGLVAEPLERQPGDERDKLGELVCGHRIHPRHSAGWTGVLEGRLGHAARCDGRGVVRTSSFGSGTGRRRCTRAASAEPAGSSVRGSARA